VRYGRSFALLLGFAGAVHAQGSITGVVVDSAGRPLADAEVLVRELNRRERSDSAGRFSFYAVKAGRYQVFARRLGYFPSDFEAVARDGKESTIRFVLRQKPALLDTVTIASTCGRFDFTGFMCRQKKGARGIFMDVDQIDSANVSEPFQLISNRPGFRMVPTRSGMSPEPTTGWKCMNVAVNGRMPTGTHRKPEILWEVIGVEIYIDPDSIPAEYSHLSWGKIKSGRQSVSARCSLAIYWTIDRYNP
jgi:hypothetical protein